MAARTLRRRRGARVLALLPPQVAAAEEPVQWDQERVAALAGHLHQRHPEQARPNGR